MLVIGCSEFGTESAYRWVPSETRVCQLPFMCEVGTADIKDAEKEQPRVGVSIVLAKDFEAQHCFGLTCDTCTHAVHVKGFAFRRLLLPNLQHPR